MQTVLYLSALVPFLSLAAASCGETAARVCYDGTNGSVKQNVAIEDVDYAAAYFRNIADTNTGLKKLWRMPASVDCQEWTLPLDDGQTVLALAKHIDKRKNSTVLYSEIADAIDGGASATAAQRSAALVGACGTNGGMVGVKVNTSNPVYTSAEFKKTGDVPGGIIVKIVRDPNYKP